MPGPTPYRDPSPARAVPDLVPARMVNEFVYCPRLAYLEWVQGEFAHSADTLEGQHTHRQVDQVRGRLPEPGKEGTTETLHARSVQISAPHLGLVAVIDLIERGSDRCDGPESEMADRRAIMPVDYKKRSAPDIPEGAWEADRVQVAVQALILRENGYEVRSGVVYYAASKTRVEFPIDDTLRHHALDAVDGLRRIAESGPIPPPLVDSPKCPGCSLVGICLPDEVRYLARKVCDSDGTTDHPALGLDTAIDPVNDESASPDGEPRIRPLVAARDDTRALYIQTQGAYVSKKGEVVQVLAPGRTGKLAEARINEVSQISLFGNIQVTTQALQAFCDSGIPVLYFSYGGWFRGMTMGLPSKNIELRMSQFRAASEAHHVLDLSQRFVAAKIENQRTLIRRNHPDRDKTVLARMKSYIHKVSRAADVPSILGIEGSAARLYFEQFPMLLKPRETGEKSLDTSFDFETRNRRPPKDPVNALLSYGYSMLAKDLTVTCWSVGLDPFLGFLHRPRYGRPALALDLMEEFRPLVVDSTVLTAINTGVIRTTDFIRRGPAVSLTPGGRKKFLQAYERRMDSLVTHPIFGYSLSYRRLLEVQARLLSRYLQGEIPNYMPFTTR